MGFRFHRRINLGNGTGINVSKSGISSSWRTQYGTIGSKGFSIRTGIPGLTWRSGYGGKSGGSVMPILLLLLGGFIIAYNLIRFVIWFAGWILSNIFTEQGVNFKFLFGFLATVTGLSVGLYYYTPPTTSAPTPAPKIQEAPTVAVVDSTLMEVKAEKPKRKKRDRIATKSDAQKVQLEETLVESENKEPEQRAVVDPIPLDTKPDQIVEDANQGGTKTSETPSETTSTQKVEDVNADDAQNAKWYQFRKKREERKKKSQEQGTENESQKE